MSKLVQYLGQNLSGEVSEDSATREYMSRDGSVLKITPQVVVFPRTTDDIRKTTRFSWRLAEKGMKLPITPRGYGSDVTGSAIGSGVSMVFPAHMSKVLELDTKAKKVRVQSGINMRTLEEVLVTHGLYLPASPLNPKNATLGGSLGTNVAGPMAATCGDIRKYTEALQVILSNGELIETRRLSKRELNQKKGLNTLEGEIYRELDALITEDYDAILSNMGTTPNNNTGYHLWSIKGKDGSFDMTPLLVGSQGTLAIISQSILSLEVKSVETSLMMVALRSTENFDEIISAVNAYNPKIFDFIDSKTIDWIRDNFKYDPLNGMKLDSIAGIFIIEFDGGNGLHNNRAKKVFKLFEELGAIVQSAETADDKEDIWALRNMLDNISNYHKNNLRAVVFDAANVPIEYVPKFYNYANDLIDKRKVTGFVFGRMGMGNVSAMILVDTNKIGHRQAILNFGDDLYSTAIKLGGSLSGDSGDGRLRQESGRRVYGDQMLGIFEKVKNIFDPKGILNPGVVIGTESDDLIRLIDNNPQLRFVENRPRV